ncbi:hypothetical protein TNCV_3164261 [Trichonephila clavipes]|nr:hypothetical protein TNCV_3164261 [Trichonephila clavipes]
MESKAKGGPHRRVRPWAQLAHALRSPWFERAKFQISMLLRVAECWPEILPSYSFQKAGLSGPAIFCHFHWPAHLRTMDKKPSEWARHGRPFKKGLRISTNISLINPR